MSAPPHPLYRLWTIQLGRWRLAQKLGIFLLDVTAKSGIKAFAPDMHDVLSYKYGKLSQDEYTRIYLERMKLSRETCPLRWESLKARPDVAIACYCKEGVFCHRHLFNILMRDYLEASGATVAMMGELLPEMDAPDESHAP